MKKCNIKILTLFLASALLLTSPVYSGNTDTTVQSYEDQLAYVAQKQQETLAELERIRNEQSGAWTELNQYDKLIALTEQKRVLAIEQLETIETQIQEKEEEILTTSEEIAVQEDAFLKRMASYYMEGDAGYLEILLGAENLVDFLTRLDRIQAIRDSDKAIINDLNQKKADLILAQEALEKSQELQVATIKDFETAILDTKSLYDQKLARLNELNQNEDDAVAVYEYFKKLDEELNAELQNYLAELQRKQQSLYIGGSMAWPLDSGATYYYSSEFGWRTVWGKPDNHLGLDIACAQNTKILAANGGTVLISEEHWSYGNYVLIDHGGGMATLYAHMTSRAVSVGDTVSLGQVIGYVGTTGMSTGFHLHFEVRKNGVVQQPRDYISGPRG